VKGTRPGRVDHVALAVPRLAWHVALFEEVFGMAVTAEDLGEPHQVWLDGGLQLIEGHGAPAAGGVLAHVAIEVEDRACVTAALARSGCVELERGPSRWSLGEGLVVELVDAPR
jgi:catechol 2,3-dioxygenase-like lactoylglutathione lyase family enzyme